MYKVKIDYPSPATFNVEKIPATLAGKTKLIRKLMREHGIDSPCHDYSDYVVEVVRVRGKTHHWYLGS